MIFMVWWIAIGVVTLIVILGAHLLNLKKESSTLRELLDAANPNRKKVIYRILNNILAPVLGSVFIVVAWPVAIYLKAKELFPRRDEESVETEREFAVENEHLLERLSVQDIELREIVHDPLGAVSSLAFGHLHDAWNRFVNNLPEGAELWSFSALWKTPWSQNELRKGYVAVHDGKPGAYFSTIWKQIDEEA